MRLNEGTKKTISCLWMLAYMVLLVIQVVFITIKLEGAISWSWWTTLIPSFCVVGLLPAVIVIAVIVLLPKALAENNKRRRRVDAEAKKYGMKRQPGESTGDLKKRIVRRNMIAGNYTRKDIKDMILENFPTVGSCQILVNNQTNEILLIPRNAETEMFGAYFTDDTLREIEEFAAKYIPAKYTIIAKNATDAECRRINKEEKRDNDEA